MFLKSIWIDSRRLKEGLTVGQDIGGYGGRRNQLYQWESTEEQNQVRTWFEYRTNESLGNDRKSNLLRPILNLIQALGSESTVQWEKLRTRRQQIVGDKGMEGEMGTNNTQGIPEELNIIIRDATRFSM